MSEVKRTVTRRSWVRRHPFLTFIYFVMGFSFVTFLVSPDIEDRGTAITSMIFGFGFWVFILWRIGRRIDRRVFAAEAVAANQAAQYEARIQAGPIVPQWSSTGLIYEQPNGQLLVNQDISTQLPFVLRDLEIRRIWLANRLSAIDIELGYARGQWQDSVHSRQMSHRTAKRDGVSGSIGRLNHQVSVANRAAAHSLKTQPLMAEGQAISDQLRAVDMLRVEIEGLLLRQQMYQSRPTLAKPDPETPLWGPVSK